MFNILNPYMLYIKLGAAVLAVVAIFGSGMWLEGTIKGKQISDLKAQQLEKAAQDATTSLDQLAKDIGAINSAAASYAGQKADYDKQFAAISKGLNDAIKNRPLPVDCVPDDGRVRSLRAAIEAANHTAAGQSSGPAVPGNP